MTNAQLYAALGDTRVHARKLTRRSFARDFSPAATCVWHLWMASRDFADAHRVHELPLALLSPRNELAREWIDRCVALVREWRIDVVREAQRRRQRTSSAEG